MSKSSKSKQKLKHSIAHIIRKVFAENSSTPLNHKQVCAIINVKEAALRKLVFNTLETLSEQSYLKKVGYGVYEFNGTSDIFEGIVQMTASRSAYIIVDDPEMKDIYISQKNTNQAIDKDRVKVQVLKRGKSKIEGTVLEVLERERVQFVGTIQMHEKFAFLRPDNARVGTDLFIPKEKLKNAKDGDKVLAKITVWPKSADNPYGEVVEVLSHLGSNEAEMIGILVNQGLDYTFPDAVMSEAESVTLKLDQKEIKRRRDLRDVDTFTIDPVDAKDFDDALSYKKLENGNIEVGVHIADVSHYVRLGTAMDEEALKRSNSVYLVDRVIPMLPEQLSNVVCSLRPNEDKFSFSAVFEIDEKGKVYNQWFGKTVIHSNQRYSYEQAQEIIEGAEGKYQTEILVLDKIAKILRKKRLDNGAMNIESKEIRFQLDEDGNPETVVEKISKDAHKLIEEFMLLANRKVAEYVSSHKDVSSFVYRCHDKPSPEKVALFEMFVKKFGYDVDVTNPDSISKNINHLLNDIRYTNEFDLIQSMAIRSMAKATYEVTNIGHYGLGFANYTHFTSPIRRYADLVVHRILFDALEKRPQKYNKGLDEICKRISRMERKAVEAERESNKFFQTLFLSDRVGETFEGTVSGVAEFGMFVRINENACEGMIPIPDLPGDHFYFDADKHAIIGRRYKKEYNFGDAVEIQVMDVNKQKRQINFKLIE